MLFRGTGVPVQDLGVAARGKAGAAAAAQDAQAGESLDRAAAGTASSASLPSWTVPANRKLDLHGFVTGPDQAPIPGAEIRVLRPLQQASLGLDPAEARALEEIATVRTSVSGEWRFRAEPGVFYDLSARAGDLLAPVVRLCQAGERVDFQLAAGAIVQGSVSAAEDGSPAAGAQVRLTQLRSSAYEKTVQTGADGRFRVADLAPGPWVLQVYHEDFEAPDWIRFTLAAGQDVKQSIHLQRGTDCVGRVVDDSTDLPIAGAEISDSWTFQRLTSSDAEGRFRLRGAAGPGRGAELHARAAGYGRRAFALPLLGRDQLEIRLLRARTVTGLIVLADGSPAAGASVAVVTTDVSAEPQQSDWLAAPAGADGRFEIVNVRADLRHALLVKRPGSGQIVHELPLTEMEQERLDVGTVRLPAAGTLAGVVRDSTGAGLAGCTIQCVGWNADRARWNAEPIVDLGIYLGQLSARSDDLGRFRFADLAPGTYRLSAARPGWLAGEPLEISLTEGDLREDLRLVLNPGKAITGRVVGPDGTPLAQLGLKLSSAEKGFATRHVFTDAAGAFEFTGLKDGRYALEVPGPRSWAETHEGRHLLSRTVTDLAAGAAAVEVKLPWAATITGTIVNEAGQPARTSVQAWTPDGQRAGSATSAADGRFTLWVEEGAIVDLTARLSQRSAEVRLTGISAGATDVRLQLPN